MAKSQRYVVIDYHDHQQMIRLMRDIYWVLMLAKAAPPMSKVVLAEQLRSLLERIEMG